MKKTIKALKNIWLLNFVRRVYLASSYYNKKYAQIIRWGFTSNENTNFTYHLTQSNLKSLAHTLSVVTKLDYRTLMGYMEEIESNHLLKQKIVAIIDNTEAGKFADKEVRFGRRIGWYAIARAIKPKVIVETGVDKGLGSVVLCEALAKNKEEGFDGRYYGTDINPKAGYLMHGMKKENGEILYGDSIKSLTNFGQKIDLFINDSDHSSDYEYQEYLAIMPLISSKTIILGDNSHITDKLASFSLETNRKFLLFREKPLNHWYPGGGIGISYE